jgi:hypothetical protein
MANDLSSPKKPKEGNKAGKKSARYSGIIVLLKQQCHKKGAPFHEEVYQRSADSESKFVEILYKD